VNTRPIVTVGRRILLDGLGDLIYILLEDLGMPKQVELLQGTLDMLILKAISLGALHGYGVLLRLQQLTGGRLQIQQGSLYPALYRLEKQGLIASEWGESENNRKAKFYTLTAAGRKQLKLEAEAWSRFSAVVGGVLDAVPEES
jgi:PadR family transcriptional regulator PadR